MHTLLVVLLQIAYALSVIGLALYGFHALWLSWHYRRYQEKPPCRRPAPDQEWPTVTVQLPIYNEYHVVERLIDACARLDYPSDKLEIQVLDDSDDQTTALAQRCAARWRRAGRRVTVIRRASRQGYKAGALAHALPLARGEFIAIFDADFMPPVDFLRRTIPYFLDKANARLGFVQARWGHLNADYSLLTRCQALALDGHFVVEQAGRQAAGYPFGFNGSAGIWRRACIEDEAVGQWQSDTLCEDLDLSYRAQLAGWQALYLNSVEAPAEIPPQLSAFKRQQFRWAKGSVQALRKLAGPVWRSGWPLVTRLAALAHLGSYLIHPLLLTMVLLSLPLMALGVDPAAPLSLLSLTSLGPPLLYATAQRRLHPQGWFWRWARLPVLMLLGTGLSFNNSLAVAQGLLGHHSQFLRTPKFHVQRAGDGWQQSRYRLPLEVGTFVELGLTLYALAAVGLAAYLERWWSIPFLAIYAGGYGLMAGVALWQAWEAFLARPEQPASRQDGRALPTKGRL